MADIQARGTLFPETIVADMFNKVKGSSAIANLCGSTPIPFNGMKEFTFTMDKEVDLVAESAPKSKGGITVTPTTIVPVKVEYGARVSDEFKYGSEEVKLDYMSAFA